MSVSRSVLRSFHWSVRRYVTPSLWRRKKFFVASYDMYPALLEFFWQPRTRLLFSMESKDRVSSLSKFTKCSVMVKFISLNNSKAISAKKVMILKSCLCKNWYYIAFVHVPGCYLSARSFSVFLEFLRNTLYLHIVEAVVEESDILKLSIEEVLCSSSSSSSSCRRGCGADPKMTSCNVQKARSTALQGPSEREESDHSA